MKRTIAASLLAVGLLAGCGSSDDTQLAAGSSTGSGGGDREDALKETAQGYYDAMLDGNLIGMSAYHREGECEDELGGMMMFGGGEMFKQIFAGVDRLKVTEVKVDGNRGEVLDGKIEGDVSDATERLFSGDSAEEEPDLWKYVDGKWWVDCSPASTPSAVTS